MNKIKSIIAVVVAVLTVGAIPALADGDGLPECQWEEACFYVGIVYDNNIDGPAAHALAALNTANGIPTVALPTNDDLSNPGGFRVISTVQCWVLMGPGTVHNSGSNALPRFSPGESDARVVGVDRYATAEESGKAVRDCNAHI